MSTRPHRALQLTLTLLVALALPACDDSTSEPTPPGADMASPDADMGPGLEDTPDDAPGAPQAAVLRFAPTAPGFFDLPFPSDARLDASGALSFQSWTRAQSYEFLRLWFNAAEELVAGFSPISGVFVAFTQPIDPQTLPATEAASVDTSAGWPSVFLMDVDAGSPQRGELWPISCEFDAPEGTLQDANLLGCKSPFGLVRRLNTRYAFFVTSGLRGEGGEPVEADAAMQALLAGEDVPGPDGRTIASADYTAARAVAVEAGLDASQLVAVIPFTVGDPSARLRRINAFYAALPTPTLDADKGITLIETYDDYVVLEAYYHVPIIQAGAFPYDNPPDGKIVFNDAGEVVKQGDQSIRVFITIPRAPQPAAGYPLMMYMHGSGGVARELMDRGAQPDAQSPAVPGSGPGGVVARFGVAGFAADFQFHGMRFDPPDTTGLKLYNLIGNPRATVDNFIVAANEVTLHARLMQALTIDVELIQPSDQARALIDLGDSPDGLIRFDDARFAAMGQSMGSTIGLPAMTIDRVTDAAIFSGSGGILIEIAVTSLKPINVGGLLRLLLRYRTNEPLDQFDPALHAVQHVWDFVDPTVHARHVFQTPFEGVPAKHVIQHSGLMDGYFTPVSRAAFSVAIGAPLAEPVYEPSALEVMRWRGLGEALQTPLQGNHPSGVTAAVLQYPPQVLDGHNVAYQRQDAQDQYGCFVRSLSADSPPIIRDAAASTPDACP